MQNIFKIKDKIKIMEFAQYGFFVIMVLIPFVRRMDLADIHQVSIFISLLCLGIMVIVNNYVILFTIEYYVVKYFERITDKLTEMEKTKFEFKEI